MFCNTGKMALSQVFFERIFGAKFAPKFAPKLHQNLRAKLERCHKPPNCKKYNLKIFVFRSRSHFGQKWPKFGSIVQLYPVAPPEAPKETLEAELETGFIEVAAATAEVRWA